METKEILEFCKSKLLPPLGYAKTYESGRTDVGDYKKALELLLEIATNLL